VGTSLNKNILPHRLGFVKPYFYALKSRRSGVFGIYLAFCVSGASFFKIPLLPSYKYKENTPFLTLFLGHFFAYFWGILPLIFAPKKRQSERAGILLQRESQALNRQAKRASYRQIRSLAQLAGGRRSAPYFGEVAPKPIWQNSGQPKARR